MIPTIKHSGCMGDVISSLPIARHIGGAHYAISQYANPEWAARKGMRGARYAAIEPLLAIQPCVKSVRFDDDAEFDLDLMNWRGCHRKNRTLTASQADYLGITDPIDMSPWLKNITPDTSVSERIIVARTARYHNASFPWNHLAATNARRMLFIGSTDEHAEFCARFGVKIEYRKTKDLLEAAQLIAGSELVISNQTACCWIAHGLGHPLILEVSPVTQDSIVPRANAQFCLDGRLVEPAALPVSAPIVESGSIEVLTSPPVKPTSVSPMLILLGYCAADKAQAVALSTYIADMGGVENHDCLVIHPQDTNLDGVEVPLRAAFNSFESAIYNATLSGWPYGPNELAAFAMRHEAAQKASHYLWLEPDCVPMHPKWADDISDAWKRGGRPMLGVVVDTVFLDTRQAVGRHTVGVAVYPGDFSKRCPLVKNVTAMSTEYSRAGQIPMAFDAYFGPYSAAMTAPTTLIQHLWRSRDYREESSGIVCSMGAVNGRVESDAVLVHGAKDGSLLEILRRRIAVAHVKRSVITQAAAAESKTFTRDPAPPVIKTIELSDPPPNQKPSPEIPIPPVIKTALVNEQGNPPPPVLSVTSTEEDRRRELLAMKWAKLRSYARQKLQIVVNINSMSRPQLLDAVLAEERKRGKLPWTKTKEQTVPVWTGISSESANSYESDGISPAMKQKMLELRKQMAPA